MDIIDSEGRLFGRVNIIDVLVLLVVLALAAAAIALVGPVSADQGDNNTTTTTITTTTTTTVRLSNQPDDVARLIQPGDTLTTTTSETRSMQILDVHRTPARDGRADVVVLVRTNDSREQRFRTGEDYDFQSDTYRTNGTISEVGVNRSSLATTTTNVTVETSLSSRVASAVSAGDRYRVAGETVAQIENVTVVPTRNGQDHVRMRLSLTTLETSESTQFAGRPVRLDQSIQFGTGEYSFSASIAAIGTSEIGIDRRTTPVRIETTVPTSTADAITEGDEYRVSGRTMATVESVSVFPTGNADRKRVQVAVTLRTTEDNDQRITFFNQPVETGSSLTLRMGEYTLDGEVINRGSLDPAGTAETVNATVRLDGVSPVVARSIPVGAVERSRGQVYARVTDTEVEPATTILTTDDGQIYQREHPVNQDVTLSVELTARRTDSGLQFHGQRIRNGQSISFDFGSVSVNGTVFGL